MANVSPDAEPDQPPFDAPSPDGLTLQPWAVTGIRKLVKAANDPDASRDDQVAAAFQLVGYLAALAAYDAGAEQ